MPSFICLVCTPVPDRNGIHAHIRDHNGNWWKSYLKLSEKFVKLEIKEEEKKRTRRCIHSHFPHLPVKVARRFGFSFDVSANGLKAQKWRGQVSFDFSFFSSPFGGKINAKHFSYHVRNIRLSQFKAIFSLIVEPQMRLSHDWTKFCRRKWRQNMVEDNCRVINAKRLIFTFLLPPKTIYCAPAEVSTLYKFFWPMKVIHTSTLVLYIVIVALVCVSEPIIYYFLFGSRILGKIIIWNWNHFFRTNEYIFFFRSQVNYFGGV